MIAMTLWPNSWPFVFSQAPPPFLWFSWQSPDVRTAPEMSEFWSDCVAKPAPGEEEQRAWQFLHSKRSGWSEVGTVRIAENRNCLCLFGKKYRLCLGCRTVLLLREPKEFWLQKMCKLSSKEISSSPASLRRFTWQRSANYIAHHSTVDVYSVYSGCGFDLFGNIYEQIMNMRSQVVRLFLHFKAGLVILSLVSLCLAASRCVSFVSSKHLPKGEPGLFFVSCLQLSKPRPNADADATIWITLPLSFQTFCAVLGRGHPSWQR